MSKNVKTFSLALAFGLVFTVLASFSGFATSCDGIRDNVLRLHILPNSDSTDDQHLKLLVRDDLLAAAEDMLDSCDTKEEAVECLRQNRDYLQSVARDTVVCNGYDYTVDIQIKKADFDTRVYEDFTLPAGEYDALCVTIGEAAGQNWWCVMFPTLCIGAAADKTDRLPDDQAEVMGGGERFQVKFRAVEIFEEIRAVLNF